MAMNAFINKPQPTDTELAAALGPAKAVWDQLLAELSQEQGVNDYEWKSFSPKVGWSLRVKHMARTIVWLSPSDGSFMAAFILGDKALRATRQFKFPQRDVRAISEAPKYPEGTGIRLEVKLSRDIGTLKKLAAIKLANRMIAKSQARRLEDRDERVRDHRHQCRQHRRLWHLRPQARQDRGISAQV
jgi:hypothetical protein